MSRHLYRRFRHPHLLPHLAGCVAFPVSAQVQVAPGDLICMVTDGVTEAQNPAAGLYGGARLRAIQETVRGQGMGAAGLLAAVRADVARFADGAEPADDLTILALRWNGPTPSGR
jgi:serine phosphatase RsbU (regulator of sigma subunit)